MTTYVSLGEDDLAIELARLIDTSILNNTTTDATDENTPSIKLVLSNKYTELIQTGILQQAQKLNNTDVSLYTTALSLVCSVLDRVTDENELQTVVKQLVQLITDKQYVQQNTQIKLRLLINLFNQLYSIQYNNSNYSIINKQSTVLNEPNLYVLYSVLQYAIDTKQQSTVQKHLTNLSDYLDIEHSTAVHSNILLAAYNITVSVANDTVSQYTKSNLLIDADQYLYQYLQVTSDTTSALPYAATAAIRTIISPLQPITTTNKKQQTAATKTLQQPKTLDAHRLLQLPAIQQLQQSTQEHKLLYELLKIVNNSNVNTYLEFYNKNKSFIESQHIDHAFILSKLRTLTLCHLGLTHDTLSINSVKSALQLTDVIDVESAVIDAIMCGRLDGRIDEATDTIIIKRVTGVNLWDDTETNKTNSMNNWNVLSTKLSKWKENVSAVLQTMHQNTGGGHVNEQPEEIMVED